MSIPRAAAVDYAEILDHEAQPVGPIHPGVILQEEFLDPLGLSAYALAKALSVPRNRITEITHGERSPPIRRCGSPASSARQRTSGSDCRWRTTSKLPAPRSARGWKRK
jgi:hypothetical protein